MDRRPHFLMTEPAGFEVCYQINPWMKPDAWRSDPDACRAQARAAFEALKAAVVAAGGEVEAIDGVAGLPDLVFPANAAVVLDGKVLLARFRHPERQGEEPVFRAAFEQLRRRGLVREIVELPDGLFHEGAGDCIWDATRGHFWGGYGPRSSYGALDVIRQTFARDVVPLELASDRFYHLDTCFCPLSGGEVLYHPEAFTPAALARIRARVAPARRVEASAAEAAAFCVNAVNLGRTVIMARAPDTLRKTLAERGYDLVEVDLDPFILSGGAAYCMTLRLDRSSVVGAAPGAARRASQNQKVGARSKRALAAE